MKFLYTVLFISLKRDSCNKIQTAKLVARAKKSGHITPVLMRLHWLPINARIDFKILLFINNQARVT